MKHIKLFEEFVNEASEPIEAEAARLGKVDFYKIDYLLNGKDSLEQSNDEKEAIKIAKELDKEGADYVRVSKYFKQSKFNKPQNIKELNNLRLVAFSGDKKYHHGDTDYTDDKDLKNL